jgi:hypothetical protein
VGLYKSNPVDPELESAWFQTLKLKCDFRVSNYFAFKFYLCRYTTAAPPTLVGMYKSIPVDP